MSEDNKHYHRVTADVIEAGAFQLVDKNGKTRAELMSRSDDNAGDGYVVVHLYDKEGRPRITLQVSDKEGPSVSLFNGTNSPCISLGVFEGSGNGITLCDSKGMPRFSASASCDNMLSAGEGDARIECRDSEGRVIWAQPR